MKHGVDSNILSPHGQMTLLSLPHIILRLRIVLQSK